MPRAPKIVLEGIEGRDEHASCLRLFHMSAAAVFFFAQPPQVKTRLELDAKVKLLKGKVDSSKSAIASNHSACPKEI